MIKLEMKINTVVNVDVVFKRTINCMFVNFDFLWILKMIYSRFLKITRDALADCLSHADIVHPWIS